jgi:exopolysaccharide biosynthesis WecB/TagA/CpsF family protein
MSTIRRVKLFTAPLDSIGLLQCLSEIEQHGLDRFEYVVTPNVDHIVRISKIPQLLNVYDSALLSLCDSRIIRLLARFCDIKIPEVITGSDLTRLLFERIINQKDEITIIGSDGSSIEKLKAKYRIKNIYHYRPPMGFIKEDLEVNKCVDFVSGQSSRFIFFAVGSPQQEILAHRVYQNGKSVGLGFCIGASINFLTGIEKRAPVIVQKFSMEWLYRLLKNPRRLWKRYLVEDIKIFPIFFQCLWRKLANKKYSNYKKP